MLKRFIAAQLIQPKGLFGKYMVGPLWNRHNAALNDATLEQLHLGAEDRVLDVGFGGGYLLYEMLNSVTSGMVTGLDASPLMVEQALKKFRNHVRKGIIDLRLGTVEILPFADEYFDKACSVNSIFYWSDIRKGLNEIFRVLRKNGLLVLTFTSKQDLDKRGFAQFGVRSINEDKVLVVAQSVGFRNVEITRMKDTHRAFFVVVAAK